MTRVCHVDVYVADLKRASSSVLRLFQISGNSDDHDLMRVACSNLTEGATLASDAVDRNGRLIVASGTCLTERHVKGLRTWGISSVEIHADGVTEEAEPEPLDPKEEARIRARFVRAPEDPISSRLLQLCLDRAARRGAGA